MVARIAESCSTIALCQQLAVTCMCCSCGTCSRLACVLLCPPVRYLGVGSSNRKNQWQARILYHGKVTHLGYYRTEEEAARVYDKVSISLHGAAAQTNFPIDQVSAAGWLVRSIASQSY